MTKRYLTFLIALFLTISASGNAAADGRVYREELTLLPNHTYVVSIWMKANIPDLVATMSLNFLNQNGERVGFAQGSRGLGSGGNWQPIGLEITTPTSFSKAELIVQGDKNGSYQWDRLEIEVVERETDRIREYWESRFEMYGTIHTGLVVDGRHLDLQRGMSPRIYSESGQLIYGGVLASMDVIQNLGVAAYGREITPDLYRRIQVDPKYPYALALEVKALGIVDQARTSVYISDEDAQRILEALVRYDFLARYAVVFLLP